jgi:hypothetical protein
MNSNTQKTLKTEMLKTEIGKASLPVTHHASRITQIAAPEWWTALPEGEKTLLRAIGRMLRGAKRSQLQEVARAAAKWERGIGCFIKVRLINQKLKRGKLKAES